MLTILNLTSSETKMLRKNGWISVAADGNVTWTAKPHTQAGAFKSVRTAARSGNLYQVKGKLVVAD